MPHDKNGNPIECGDNVVVRFTVREVYPGADFCGVVLGRAVEGEQQLSLTCQTKQTELVVPNADNANEQALEKAILEHGERMLPFFRFAHLPPKLRAVSEPFGTLAAWVVDNLPGGPERTVALRKLLEAKDCAVRAAL